MNTIDSRSGLTEKQVELLRGKLLSARDAVLARAAGRRPAQAALEGEAPGDPADQAELTFEQGLRGTLSTSDQVKLREIDDALARLERGSYGADEETGEPIGFDRLSAAPWARFTQEHQEQLEAASPAGRPPSL
jgi:DnaK suppressor protein